MGLPDPFPAYTQEEIDDALTAVIAYAGNVSAARKYLEAEGKRVPCHSTLANWTRTVHWERYEELREKLADKNAKTLENNYLDAARYATETTMLAVEKARERLEKGEDQDPARTAANLSRVSQTAVEKRHALQGVPKLKEDYRDLTAILRGLAANYPKLITIGPESPQIEGGASDRAE